MTIEGYAAIFGIRDQMEDIVRAGAFRASLARRTGPLPIFLEHEPRLLAGYWSEAGEDTRGLYVVGSISDQLPGAARAKRALARGVDGLSIGFIAIASSRAGKTRLLEEIELIEVSIVTHPMQPLARLRQSPARGQPRLPIAA